MVSVVDCFVHFALACATITFMAQIKSWILSDAFWNKIGPLIPVRQRAANRSYQRKPGAGRKPMPARQILTAIVYVLHTGCQWKALPREFGSASAIHAHFQSWQKEGFFVKPWQAWSNTTRWKASPWRWQSIDGAMGNAPLAKRCVGADPTDREEKRRKRSLLANARGVPLSIAVSGANTHDVKLLAKTLEAVVCERPKPRKWKPQHLCADAGYNGNAAKETVIAMNYRPHIEQRKEESSDKKRKPGCKARRWVVEQTHSWLNRFGKLPHE
jgi:transposase